MTNRMGINKVERDAYAAASLTRNFSLVRLSLNAAGITLSISSQTIALCLLAFLFATCCAIPAFAAGCDGSGNCYIRAGASGTGTGANWTNAYTGFGTGAGKVNPASMARGITYWIAAGAYGGQTFSTPDSGSTVITIEGATTLSHGPATDWNSSFAGQATFIGAIGGNFTTDYWTVIGGPVASCSYPEGTGDSGDSCYAIHFWNKTSTIGSAIVAANHETFKYVELEGTGQGFPNNSSTSDKCNSNNCGVWSDNAVQGSPNNLYIGYSYVHHTGNTQFQMNNTPAPSGQVYEYNWVSYNHTGQNGQHDEAYSLYASNVTIRYNVFQDISGTGIITDAGAATPPLSNWEVYGNLFFWDSTFAAFNGQYSLATIDNAIVAFLGEQMSGHIYFYNNTMAGFYNSVANQDGAAFSTLALSGLSGESSGNPTVQVYNNLWWDSAYTFGDYTSYCQAVPGASCTQDYDAFYIGNVISGDFQNPTETHGYTVSSSSVNPFVNSSASSIAGFMLTTPDPFTSHPGVSLQAPYNVDLYGTTRGANGTWDRGALQLPSGGGGGGAPLPPTNLTVTGVQ